MDKNNFVVFFKINSLLLSENLEKQDSMKIKNEINYRNVTLFYQLAKSFKCVKLTRSTLCFIERFFTIVSETQSFLRLELKEVLIIFASSELNVDSEMEILNSIEKWVEFNYEKRNIFVKKLLLKVRLHLLRPSALNSLFSKKIFKNSNAFPPNRFCTQNMFEIVGPTEKGMSFYSIEDFTKVTIDIGREHLNLKCYSCYKMVYCRGEIYWFGDKGFHPKLIDSAVHKYSLVDKTCEHVTDVFDDRNFFAVCSLVDQIYVIGGYDRRHLKSCMKLCTKTKRWEKVGRMGVRRASASCCVFQGRIVACGGVNISSSALKSVEAYDDVADKWLSMPSMVKGRYYCKSVSKRNKLFVVESLKDGCEVYDCFSNKFSLLKSQPRWAALRLSQFGSGFVHAISVGSEIVLVSYRSTIAVVYDVEKDKWTERNLGAKFYFSNCIIIPQVEV